METKLLIRLSKEDRDKLKKEADRRRIGLSTYARMCLIEKHADQ